MLVGPEPAVVSIKNGFGFPFTTGELPYAAKASFRGKCSTMPFCTPAIGAANGLFPGFAVSKTDPGTSVADSKLAPTLVKPISIASELLPPAINTGSALTATFHSRLPLPLSPPGVTKNPGPTTAIPANAAIDQRAHARYR